MHKKTRHKITVDKSRIIFIYNDKTNRIPSVSLEYTRATPEYFAITKPGQLIYLRNIDGVMREKNKTKIFAACTKRMVI